MDDVDPRIIREAEKRMNMVIWLQERIEFAMTQCDISADECKRLVDQADAKVHEVFRSEVTTTDIPTKTLEVLDLVEKPLDEIKV